MKEIGTPISDINIEGKPRITRIVLSRHRVRWVILLNGGLVGFKKQTQFKTFGSACFIASCIASQS